MSKLGPSDLAFISGLKAGRRLLLTRAKAIRHYLNRPEIWPKHGWGWAYSSNMLVQEELRKVARHLKYQIWDTLGIPPVDFGG